ncbi:hypothetical protein [Limnothrix redekei]|uniref:Uncharacterized protein n=1 Tax=Limnothrix redekei LRLZ20PSL1 TaxID=3112953 RepID=A0ABW7CCX8_9CYAN
MYRPPPAPDRALDPDSIQKLGSTSRDQPLPQHLKYEGRSR